ncbi:MAG: glycosyltransferase family 2 protein [Flavobacteriaceae bacterium]
MIDVSVITINYNSADYTQECVRSVLQHTQKEINYEILIVDNASKDGELEKVREFVTSLSDSRVRLLESRINTGFGGGNMFGVQHAKGAYYLFLNNDARFDGDTLATCLRFMEETPDAAVCGPRILDGTGKEQVGFDHFTSFAREVFGKRFVEAISFGKKPNRRKKYVSPLKVDYVNGSFMFFRAIDFHDVGGFDTNIFLYYEESDICLRLQKKGKHTYFLPQAAYTHHQGKSVGSNLESIDKKIELKTSLFYVIRKHHGYLHYLALRSVFALRYLVASLFKPAYFKLFLGILSGLPLGKSLKHRQIIK